MGILELVKVATGFIPVIIKNFKKPTPKKAKLIRNIGSVLLGAGAVSTTNEYPENLQATIHLIEAITMVIGAITALIAQCQAGEKE